jgi:mRNA interferase MazF
VICDRFDTVVVPFPFSEKAGSKRRPAVVLSNRHVNDSGKTILAMITTKGHKPWPGDHRINDLQSAGLPLPCIVRLKLFTIDNRLILRQLGHLGENDAEAVAAILDQNLR